MDTSKAKVKSLKTFGTKHPKANGQSNRLEILDADYIETNFK